MGIAPFRAENGACCRYLMVVTGAANKDVRFYRSLPTSPGSQASDLTADSLRWESVGRFSEKQIEECLQPDWHTGLGDAHQMLNFVRQHGIDGPL